LSPIAITGGATGRLATGAGATETQGEPTGGLSVVDEELIERTRSELHDAVQKHMRAMYGSLVTVDFFVVAENVDDEFEHILHPSVSADMTSWKLRGMSYQALTYLMQLK
jgi:hypothetical protein